jgi:glucokinase
MIIAGDIGGTNTRLALFEGRKKIREEKFKSAKYPNLGEIVLEFLHKDRVEKAVFGIAGPVRDQRCKATNLPWIIDAKELSIQAKIPHVFLINDLEANAYGLRSLRDDEFFVLNAGAKNKGNGALISAGTGLGEAGLFWNGKEHTPFACEGGHTDFAARDALEWELSSYLMEKFGHVSYERVVSGPGIANLYHFLVEKKGEKPIPEGADPLAISKRALEKSSPLCEKLIRWFCSFYGAESGNAALKFLSLSGVYLGGGIAPHILPFLKEGGFMEAFADKGRFKELLLSIPVKVVLNEDTALMGALEFAFVNKA